MVGDQALELADEVRMASEREVGLDPLFEGTQAQLLQPRDLRLGKRLVGEVVQRRSSPQPERVAEDPGGLCCLSGRQGLSALLEQRLEAARVDRLRLDAEQVARRAGHDQAVSERAANLRDGVLEHLRGRRRRLLSPEAVHEPVARDDLVRVQDQQREQGPLPAARELDRPAVHHQLQWTQDPELHASLQPHDA
jgi:hypothetical protein